MSVTVRDILQLDVLKHAKIIAGHKGLDRQVLRVNFTDCPLEGEQDFELVMRGDLYIRSFYMDREQEQSVCDIIRFYIQSGSSCCLALDQYLTEFPRKALAMAEENQYPIITIDRNVPYGDLIQSISELIMIEQSDWIAENKINRLLYDTLTQEELFDTAHFLSPHLSSGYRILRVSFHDLSSVQYRMLKSDLQLQFHIRFLKYIKGGFAVVPEAKSGSQTELLHGINAIFAHYDPDYSAGVSSCCLGLAQFASGFRQASSACEIGKLLGNKLTGYDELSVYHLLLPLRNHEVLREFCDEVLGPIKEYENRQSLHLLETVSVYLENDGDYKKTAAALSQHENTIRFRIGKVKSLLGLDKNHYTFIEKMSIALKAEKLLASHSFPEFP